MATNPLAMALQNSDPRLRQRLLYAQNMAEEGGSTAPVQSPLEGLARALKGGLGGYFAGQIGREEDAKKAETQATLARALRAGSGQENTFDPATGQWSSPTGKPDTALMAKVLSTNEQTAPMGLNLMLQDLQYQRERGDKLEDRNASQSFQREMAATQNDYQNARDNLNRAFQAAQQNNSFENQAALQRANQEFQAAQQKANQMFQIQNAGPMAGAQAAARLAAENEPTQVMMPGGEMMTVPAGAATKVIESQLPGKMTEGQSAAALYADRINSANNLLSELEGQGTEYWQRRRAQIGNKMGYNINSPEYQKFDQAKRDFVNAVLRRESGAVISPSEFENAEKQYFPVPGDSPQVIAQKKKNRETAFAGIARAAGPAYKPQQHSAYGIAPGTVQDGYKYKGGNPALPESWEKQ